MADEARAMLDALMGSSRDAALPAGASISKSVNGEWEGSRRDRKSCYDKDICPLYCAWGVDVFELFTNTKSDLGPNPYIVQEDAREEFVSLPDHEKERLGYEHILMNKLGELVGQCDRIVAKNKEKLRNEISRNARARGQVGTDPATSVKEETITEAAECIADIEFREKEVQEKSVELQELDQEFRALYKEMQELKAKSEESMEGTKSTDSAVKSDNGSSVVSNEEAVPAADDVKTENEETKKDDPAQNGDTNVKVEDSSSAIPSQSVDTAVKAEDSTDTPVKIEEAASENIKIAEPEKSQEADSSTPEQKDLKCTDMKESPETQETLAKINELKAKLFRISVKQQQLLSAIVISTTKFIVPRREALQGLQKQLYYIRSDTSNDKTVCEISGNFMSSRDAEERIAAHYAGKQYVGWKMVREKFSELQKKFKGRGPPMRGGARGPMRQGGYGNGPPPGPPPPGYGNYGQGHHGRYNDRDRSRSRDNREYSRSSRSGRRSPSPSRWERDRNGYGSNRYGGRRDDRGWGRR